MKLSQGFLSSPPRALKHGSALHGLVPHGSTKSPAHGKTGGSVRGKTKSPARGANIGIPLQEAPPADVLKPGQGVEQPAKTQKEPDNLMDMEEDKLDLESVIRREEPAHAGNPVPPHQEEDIENDDKEENAFSSHEGGEEEEDGSSREDGQKKKRKRDAKFEDKHPTD